MSTTIAAIATAYGVGSIAIIRISGDNAYKIAIKLTKLEKLNPREAKFTQFFSNSNEFIDEGIVIFFKAPHSFTGEDIVEFQIHGGSEIASILLDEILQNGAVLANPGEFSKRAFLNDKMDLAKAETIQALIKSKSKMAAKILSRTLKGDLNVFLNDLRKKLVKTLAFVETAIDYADDDLPENIIEEALNLLNTNIKKLSQIVEISSNRKGLIEGFKIAIIGKPNVGKSSILNSLLKYQRAIISDIAGTTRDTIEENLNIGSHLVKIIDTAGIRQNADKIEKIGIEYSLKAANDADIILAIFDISNKFDDLDEKILEICENSNKKIFYILNKSDLDANFDKTLKNAIKISSKNTDLILQNLEKYLNSLESDEIMLSSNRQILAVNEAIKHLKEAKPLLENQELELFSYEINYTIKEISKLTKPFERDEILDEMFSNFCLGK